jgi:predicted  nucleic acid-binding Zn-ribbon protein
MAKKQIDLLRALEELDMNLRDVTAPGYKELGFKPPSVDYLKSAEKKRVELCARIEPKLVVEYERIKKRYGSRVVVQVVNEFCGGCYVKLPLEMTARRHNDVITCPNCGRFLYLVN